MTTIDLIHKLINFPDYISEVPEDYTDVKHIKTRDGKILKDIYVDGADNVIIELEKEKKRCVGDHVKVKNSFGLSDMLKEPETRGPYYSEDSLNNYSCFESEKEANDRLIEWDKDNRFSESYVLITECRVKK